MASRNIAITTVLVSAVAGAYQISGEASNF